MSTTARLPHLHSLAARLRAGDAAALARLADATYARGLAVARTLTPTEAAAERAVLDAYVALWFARREAPDDARLEAWVLAAVGRAVAPRAAVRRPSVAARAAWVVRRRIVTFRAWAASLGGRGRRAPQARGCAGLA
jgi:hypothetical protein